MQFVAGFLLAVFLFSLESRFNQPVAKPPMWFVWGSALALVGASTAAFAG